MKYSALSDQHPHRLRYSVNIHGQIDYKRIFLVYQYCL